MTEELSNQIMKRSSSENFLAYKNKESKCKNMIKYAKKAYFQKVTAKNGGKPFWKAIKSFLLLEES